MKKKVRRKKRDESKGTCYENVAYYHSQRDKQAKQAEKQKRRRTKSRSFPSRQRELNKEIKKKGKVNEKKTCFSVTEEKGSKKKDNAKKHCFMSFIQRNMQEKYQ